MNTDQPTEKGTINISHLIQRIPKAVRGHVVAMLGEFLGTLSFIFIAFAGTQTANIASNTNTGTTVITTVVQKTPQQLLYISLSFGFSLAVNAWVFFRVSGGLFNPAVTLGMVLIGAITIVRGILLFIVQMAGAIAGAFLVSALFSGGLNVNTTLATTTSVAQGVIIEMLLTCLLCFTIFMLAAEKHVGNFIAPVGIGLALFISELVGVFWTGGSLNPARSFAPAVVSGFHSTHWVYWVGPIAGSILAVIIFKIIKVLEYETANPDPEAAAPTGPAVNVDELEQGASNRSNRREEDLERGASKERYDSTQETSSFLRNTPSTTGVTNGVVKPAYQADGVNGVNRAAYPDPAENYRVHDYQQASYPASNERVVETTQYSTQGQGQVVPEDVRRWNAVHTANARENTVVPVAGMR